jgi:hypothetical protein
MGLLTFSLNVTLDGSFCRPKTCSARALDRFVELVRAWR